MIRIKVNRLNLSRGTHIGPTDSTSTNSKCWVSWKQLKTLIAILCADQTILETIVESLGIFFYLVIIIRYFSAEFFRQSRSWSKIKTGLTRWRQKGDIRVRTRGYCILESKQLPACYRHPTLRPLDRSTTKANLLIGSRFRDGSFQLIAFWLSGFEN